MTPSVEVITIRWHLAEQLILNRSRETLKASESFDVSAFVATWAWIAAFLKALQK